MIDFDGYRPNVGIILTNGQGQLLWAKRIGQSGWQFPQGGIKQEESPQDACFRELYEEIGLLPEHVEVLGETRGWLRYRLPKRCIRFGRKPLCVGQKQKWFLLRMTTEESAVRFDSVGTPEFDDWKWIDYWTPIEEVVYFKRGVYRSALCELAHLALPEGQRSLPEHLQRHCAQETENAA